MPKVSVIIPVYNVEKYLERCLDSVINQTLKDIEIICINDCSTDNSLTILEEYASKDKRIKMISLSENKGAGYARNIGIDHAISDYIGFIDSDDFVDLDFYNKLYNKAIETGADIVKGSYKYLNNGFVEKNINERIRSDKNNFCSEFCSAIFKTSLIKINNIKFPEIIDMEDPLFAFSCALKTKDIQILDDLYVYIEERNDSLTRSTVTEKRLKDKIIGLEMLIDMANNNNIDKNCYAYVTSIWFGVIFINFEKFNINLKLIIASEVERLYQKIKYKGIFCSVLKDCDTFLSNLLLNKLFHNIVFYKELKQIEQQKNQINELKQANNIIKNCYNNIVNQFAEKYLNQICEEDIYFISVVNNYETYNNCIKQNPFVKATQNIKSIDYNNCEKNVPIPLRYNAFLDSYDYPKEAWFVFCHCDWELMDDINFVLSKLDKNFLYGPVGSKLEQMNDGFVRKLTGQCYEKRRDGSGFRLIGDMKTDKTLTDTFDCQALIVHSSLIEKTGLRFDKNLLWDLYVEDFCIQAKEIFNINSYTVNLQCCHWSGYHITPKSYFDSLSYINKKYPNSVYAGTVSIIGGKKCKDLTNKEFVLKFLREKVISDINTK